MDKFVNDCESIINFTNYAMQHFGIINMFRIMAIQTSINILC